MARSRTARGRWALRGAVLVVVVLLLPVPWLHVISDDPLGTTWRLNGRLEVNGETIDPPGRWSWLAVGRPALVGEVVRDAVLGSDDPPTDMRGDSMVLRPALAEPAAAAVGLRHAGADIPLGLLVEAYDPLIEGLPQRAILTGLQGVPLTDRAAWEQASAMFEVPETGQDQDGLAGTVTGQLSFETASAGVFEVQRTADGLPYRVIRTLDTAPQSFDARIAFAATELLPVDWFRELSLGSSHGMMVALTTYAHVFEGDLAGGRHIAGTGGIRGDGVVVPIGGLTAKAAAAKRAGADVLFYPASQQVVLAGFDPGPMALVPVATLAEAIGWLAGPVA